MSDENVKRCPWVSKDPVYIEFHDKEWGIPVHDDFKLFEMLSLEGNQAGLSWLTVLKKRDGYRKAFLDFDYNKVAKFTEKEIDKILATGNVIKHRSKIESVVHNAKCVVKLLNKHESFDKFVWSFAPKNPIGNTNLRTNAPVKESIDFADALKNLGFKFAGPKICHAFFQSIGVLHDHAKSCFLNPELKEEETKVTDKPSSSSSSSTAVDVNPSPQADKADIEKEGNEDKVQEENGHAAEKVEDEATEQPVKKQRT